MIVIPENYLLIVHVRQFTWFLQSLNWVPVDKRTEQITQFLREDIDNFTKNGKSTIISTGDELHVLRLLRHVRETVNDIKLQPDNLEFWFDNPKDSTMMCILLRPDGDLSKMMPGGFFNQRASELF